MTIAKLIVIITIELTAIAVVLIVGAVILKEKEEKRGEVVEPRTLIEFENGPATITPINRARVIEWIPVEERVPENMVTTLVTIGTMVGRGELVTTIDIYIPSRGKWRNYNGGVIAWAELPEPYKK